jgi:hypothetical protein
MRKAFVIIFFVPLLFILGYFGLRVNAAFQNGHAWADMDWDGDGRVSIVEIVEGSDIGRRPVPSEGKNCTEFFRYKDGLPIRIDCTE